MTEGLDLRNVAKFNGANFQAWKFQMRTIFVANDILDIVEGTKEAPEDSAQNKIWRKKDAKAMFILSSSMDASQLDHLLTCTSSSAMWKKLLSLHEQRSESSKLLLMTRFHDYRMSTSDSMAQHIAKVENMARQLTDVGEKISDVTIMAKLLGSLPSKYSALVTAWDSVDASSQTLDNLTARLIKEESRMTSLEDPSTALAAVSFGRSKTSKFKTQNTEDYRKNVECFYCKKKGHVIKFCRKRKRDLQHKNSPSCSDNNSANMSAFIVENQPVQENWILDSGASKHMSFQRGWFSELRECSYEYVSLGDGTTCQVKGRGTVIIKRYNGKDWLDGKLEDVLYVPSLSKNLFSVGACVAKNYNISFKGNSVEIRDGNTIAALGVKHDNNLYKMFFTVNVKEACVAKYSSLRIWHERMGHIGIDALRNMVKSGLIDVRMDPEKDFFCESCQYGKQHRLPFKNVELRNTQPGDLIHTDVGGPMQTESIGGSRFYVNFKDDATRYRQVYFMRHKNDLFDIFKRYNAELQTKFQRPIKALRLDNGGEYMNRDMLQYLYSQGIRLEPTAPYTPEQNGISERDNRTIVEKARTMLHAKGLPKYLWAEAINTAAYIQNRIPNKKGQIPFEMWTGKKANLEHFRTFGCTAFQHIPKQKRRKWDSKSSKVIFVGYSGESSNYRLYDPNTRKINVSRDVVFNEQDDGCVPPDTSEEIDLSHVEIPQGGEEWKNRATAEDEREAKTLHEESDAKEIEAARNTPNDEPRQLRDRSMLRVPGRYQANFLEFDEPQSYAEALAGPDGNKWQAAIDEELEAHQKNGTWKLETLPEGRSTVGCKWVFKVKTSPNKETPRYKARLCAKGYSQEPGIDYEEIFSPVVRYESLRTLLAIATQYDLELGQFDIKTAFLHGDLNEKIYMEVPEGLKSENGDVCRLVKSLYGLKQSPRQWNSKFDSVLKGHGFIQTVSDPCIYCNFNDENFIYLAVFVDDGLVLAKDKYSVNQVMDSLKTSFEITEEDASNFIGLQIERNREIGAMFIHQEAYSERIIDRFDLSEAKNVSVPIDIHSIKTVTEAKGGEKVVFPYREAIGSLMFLAQTTRPDIMFAVSFLSRFLTCFTKIHCQALKRLMQYVRGTKRFGIFYRKTVDNEELQGFSDADYAGDTSTRRSTTGYIFMLANGPISWCSKRQSMVSLSTTEAEYVAAAEATKELIWLRQLLADIRCRCVKPTLLQVDNQSAIKLIRNPEFHKRTKHIDIRFHFIREKYQDFTLTIAYVKSEEQCADFLTKALPKDRLRNLLTRIGVCEHMKTLG